MKYTHQFLLVVILLATCQVSAQNIGIGTKTPKNKLHVAGGVRIDSLANSKDSGIILHNSHGDVYSLKLTGKNNDVLRGDGTFSAAAAPTDAWLLGGNAGTDSSNFFGTTDNQPIKLRINNRHFGSLDTNNIALGQDAMYSTPFFQESVPAGIGNIAIGQRVQSRAKPGEYNVIVGLESMLNFGGNYNTAIGTNALRGSRSTDNSAGYGSGNTAMGASSLRMLTYGNRNTAIGTDALFGRLSAGLYMLADDNTAIGYQALYRFGSLDFNVGSNVAVGSMAMYRNLEGQENIAIGVQALYEHQLPSGTIAIGYRALRRSETGIANLAIGHMAMQENTSGNYNTAIGSQVLLSGTTASYNCAYGFQVMRSNTTGSSNTATGVRTLRANTNGSRNTGFGYESLISNTSGTNNTAIGYQADVTSGTFSNATAVGYMAKVNASNKVRIGNAAVTVIEGQVPFTTPSDGRFKYNVEEDVRGLDFIMKLRPVTYQFDVKKFDHAEQASFASYDGDHYEKAASIRRTGFIAQEVEAAAIESRYNFSGIVKPETGDEHYSLSYESFVVPLVKAVQDQQAIIERQQEQINRLQQQTEHQQQKIDLLLNKSGTRGKKKR